MKRLTLFLVTGLIFWAIYHAAVAFIFPALSERGLFGDSFGAFSALTTALAFAGTAYAVIRQEEASEEQQKQLTIQASFQQRTASAFERNSLVDLAKMFEEMRSKNAEEIAQYFEFIKKYASEEDSDDAISSARESLKKHIKAQRLINAAHHDCLERMIAEWGLPKELSNAIIDLTDKKAGDADWLELVDRVG